MEKPITGTEFVQFAEEMYNAKQGIVLARSLSLRDKHIYNTNIWLDNDALSQLKCSVSTFDELIAHHIKCVKAMYENDYVEAYNCQRDVLMAVVQIMEQNIGTNWMLPIMYTVCLDLRLIAQKADTKTDSRGAIMENAVASLMTCFRACASDDNPLVDTSKRVGMLNPANHILRIYFRLEDYNLCEHMIRTVELSVAGGSFPMAQQVVFKFYVGRLAVFKEDYPKAEKYLLFAFKKCYTDNLKNRQLILTYLLPVKLLLGFMPTKSLVDKYGMTILWELAVAVKRGDLQLFKIIVKENAGYFGNAGLLGTLENLKIITYRNVFKKVYRSHSTYKIPITCFQAGLQIMSGKNVGISQTLSLLATLIETKKIRAHLSYEQRCVIFYADIAFPHLSNLEFAPQESF